MDTEAVLKVFVKTYPKKQIDRVFLHDGMFIVEAYPKGESQEDRAYSAYYMFDEERDLFTPYSPMSTSLKEIDRFFESASNPISFN